MKYFLVFTLLTIVSCGKYEVGSSGGSIGELRSMNSRSITGVDLSSLILVCQSLLGKNVAEGQNLQFLTTEADCAQGPSAGSLVTTVIQNGSLKRLDNGLDFIFPNIETASSGVMAQVCTAIGNSNLSSPVPLPNGDVQWVTTVGISPSDCSSVSGETCVMFETGSPQNGQYQVHTKEWVRFKTLPNASKYGYFSERKKLSRSFCAQNEFVLKQATLK